MVGGDVVTGLLGLDGALGVDVDARARATLVGVVTRDAFVGDFGDTGDVVVGVVPVVPLPCTAG
ncbi:MAG: hypothetical protein ACYC1I_06035 [Acidimicrobiales bacterium]